MAVEKLPVGFTTHQGAPGTFGAPWCLVGCTGLLPCTSLAPSVSSVQKKNSKKFCGIWTSFGIDILQSKKQAKNNNWHWALCHYVSQKKIQSS